MATIFDVANYFRWRVDYDAGDNITALKLQKLCYYAQAWHLAFTGEPLFEEEFQAYDHGPLNYELWKFYQKPRGWEPIEPDDALWEFERTARAFPFLGAERQEGVKRAIFWFLSLFWTHSVLAIPRIVSPSPNWHVRHCQHSRPDARRTASSRIAAGGLRTSRECAGNWPS